MKIKYPDAIHGIVNRSQNPIFGYQGWPSICRDEQGTLYVVASGFRIQHVDPFGKTVMYKSINNGNSWSPPIIINDTCLDDRDAGVLYIGNGKILVSWFCHPADIYYHRYFAGMKDNIPLLDLGPLMGMMSSYPFIPAELASGGSFVRISEDYGITWSESIKVPGSAPHGPNICHDGSLIYVGKDMYINAQDTNKNGHIRAYKSFDGGYHWNETAILKIPYGTKESNFHEPHVIELPDKRLFCMVRAQNNVNENINVILDEGFDYNGKYYQGFTLYATSSNDGGISWSNLEPIHVSGSPPHLLLHSSGALICSYSCREKPYSERACVSYDLGATWAEDYVIDDRCLDGDHGYPSSVELEDGSIMTVYYQKLSGDKKPSILYSKWNLSM